ncbi:MAG TPA: DUF4349 domain-containing protein [Abditibacterium sp.]|jgi:hypothetical protein
MKLETPSGDAFEADLKAYLDGELPFYRRFQVRAHLARCSKCQEELKIMQTIKAELKEETAPLGADLRAKILENVPTEPSEAEFERPRMPRHIKRRLLVSGVAALLVASVVAPRFLGSPQPMNSPASPGLESFLSSGSSDEKSTSAGKPMIPQMPAPPSAAPMAGAISASSANSAKAEVDEPEIFRRRVEPNYSDRMKATNDQISASRAPMPGSAGVSSYSSNGIAGLSNQRAVHKEGNLTVEVADAEKSGADAEQIIKNVGGFVASNSLSTGAGERRSATLDCRIPVDKFELVVGKIAQLGRVRAKSINGEDITARVAAASARKSTLSNELSIASAQLRQKEKSRKAGDVASVYYARQEVRNLRLQAAQARAQLETLRRFSDLSSLYLTVQDKPKVAPVAGPTSELGITARDAWKSFLVSARLPIQLIIWILAYSPLWVPLLIVWKKWGRNWLSAA